MQISTTARHCELDPALRQFAERRLDRFARLARDIREAHLVLIAEKYRHTAEILVRLRHGEVTSREESTDPHAAIDRAAERLEEQLRRLNDRRREHRRGGRDGSVAAAPDAAAPDQDED